MSNDTNPIIIRQLGAYDYEPCWKKMQMFTDDRNENTTDEIWLVEHPPVFTQGQAGKAEHILNPHSIPVVQVDRGGQVTYHGPGQQMMYILLDIRRRNIGVRHLVSGLEEAVVSLLKPYSINAYPKADAPGVYVNEAKVASIGLRIRHGCSFHGLALNINMDLTPFSYINPCGYAGLEMIQTSELNGPANLDEAGSKLAALFCNQLNQSEFNFVEGWE
jgi:lipoyl(octanoyl) transferase